MSMKKYFAFNSFENYKNGNCFIGLNLLLTYVWVIYFIVAHIISSSEALENKVIILFGGLRMLAPFLISPWLLKKFMEWKKYKHKLSYLPYLGIFAFVFLLIRQYPYLGIRGVLFFISCMLIFIFYIIWNFINVGDYNNDDKANS